MMMIEKLEKIGRLLLWLALTALCVSVPLGMHAQRKEAAHVAEQAANERKAEQKRAKAELEIEKASKIERLPIASMGGHIRGLNSSNATGHVYFTNVSPRTGVVCVAGTATNPATQKTAESLASCKEVTAYASVDIPLMFAGGDLSSVCQNITCNLMVSDVPDPK